MSAQPYLVLYNALQSAGWLACLVYACLDGLDTHATSWAGQLTSILQLVALLETVHAMIGLVPSSPVLSLLQWFGRSNVWFLVVRQVQQVQSSPWVLLLLLLAWSLSEVIRYPWYALSGIKMCPTWLTWLRYSMFIPLYPVGVAAEMVLLYLALPELEERGLYSLALPNTWNFAFSYHVFVKVGLVLYLPIWWQLYSSMLRQRKKKLGPAKLDAPKQH